MKDLGFFILLLLGLAGAWFVAGGPERGDVSGLFLRPPAAIDPGSAFERLDFRGASRRFEEIRKELGEAARLGELSPFRGKVELETDTSGAREEDPNREYVVLSASYANAGPVSISGWRLVTEDGEEAVIGKGVRVFESGRVPPEEPIELKPGERAIVATGRSPVGVSFGVNACTGYLEQFQDFNPSLSLQCPSPRETLDAAPDLREFDQACVDFIETMPQCEMNVRELPAIFKESCTNFIATEFSYMGCLARHRGDPNFLGSEWRVFLNRGRELWGEERDVVRLVDAEGKTVDVFSY